MPAYSIISQDLSNRRGPRYIPQESLSSKNLLLLHISITPVVALLHIMGGVGHEVMRHATSPVDRSPRDATGMAASSVDTTRQGVMVRGPTAGLETHTGGTTAIVDNWIGNSHSGCCHCCACRLVHCGYRQDGVGVCLLSSQ